MSIPSEARKKQKVTHPLPFIWDVEVRDCIKDVLKSKSVAVKHPAQPIPQWLQTVLRQKFEGRAPLPTDKLVIQQADRVKGRGIFAIAALAAGTRVGAFRGAVSFDPSALATDDRTFAVEVLPGTTFDVQGGDWVGLFNHCWGWPASLPVDKKMAWEQFFANTVIDDELVLYATRDIAAGEEVCFDYGLNYWVKSPTKPLWDLSNAPTDLLDALHYNNELSLLRLSSAVRVAGNKWLQGNPGETCPVLMQRPLTMPAMGSLSLQAARDNDSLVETMSITKGAVGLLYHAAKIQRSAVLLTVAGRRVTVGMALNNRACIGDDQWDFNDFHEAKKAKKDMGAYATERLQQSQSWAYNNLMWQVLASRFEALAGGGRTLPGELARLIGASGWRWTTVNGQPLGPNGLKLNRVAAKRLGRAAQKYLLPIPADSTRFPPSEWDTSHNVTGLLARYYNGWFYLPGGEKLVAIGHRTFYIGVSANEVLVQIESDDYEDPVPPFKYMFLEWLNLSPAERRKVKSESEPGREAAAERVFNDKEEELRELRLQAWKERYSTQQSVVSEQVPLLW